MASATPDLYGYLPCRKASQPIGWYQIILLGDRGTCVLIVLIMLTKPCAL